MTGTVGAPRNGGARWAYLPGLAAVLVIGLVLAAALPPTAPAAPVGRWDAWGGWTNGILTVLPASGHPAVTVSSGAAATGWGMYAGVQAIRELHADGSPAAVADLDRSTWTVSNQSAGPAFELDYRSAANVTDSSGPIGTTEVFVNFTAGPVAGREGSADVLAFSVSIISWPWVSDSDRLALAMPLWPNDTSAAVLAPAAGVAGTIECRNSSGATLETFSWGLGATAVGTGGVSLPVSGSTQLVGGPTLTTVNVIFAGAVGGARILRYDPSVGVPSSALSLGDSIPTSGYVAAISGTVAVIGLAVGVTIRQGRRPPSLMYAEGAERR